MTKKALIILLVSIILATALFGYFKITKTTGNAIQNNIQTQEITIGFNRGYTPNTIRVKANEPVEITLDDSVGGCFRAFKIPLMKVSKYSEYPSDKITFTPTQKGTFTYQCGMGMAKGTIIVE